MSAATRFIAMISATVVGVVVSGMFALDGIDSTAFYSWSVTALLGFGLYAATTGIPLDLLRTRLRTVVLAVTLGVAAKAALIFLAMFLVFRRPEHAVLAVAVAQIDPLSVAAMRGKSRMSESARTLLTAWAAFDDPITVLLTVYVTAFALSANDPAQVTVFGAGPGGFALGLLVNLLLAGGILVGRHVLHRRREGRFPNRVPMGYAAVAAVVLAGLAAVAVTLSLMLAFALVGLFLRPPEHWNIDRLMTGAVLVAAFAVGLLLPGGISILPGVVLGVAAYASQVLIALALTVSKVWHNDRAVLALAQQNGITAIVLALTLEPLLPGTVAVVAPAILVVNTLHAGCNAIWDRVRQRRLPDERTDDLLVPILTPPLGISVRGPVGPSG